nr:DNA-directed RNA polymerase I subunit 2 [Ipomoea batatas]GMC79640.1 DNA-directed RNA polymerase I subunit 2 [Ipomoea batatas]GMC90472.1 DNA-directed RNA polymerase I subunit 2 [Ipomoea batatas]GMD78816.1 DNA-directed RNA polymerase I subunit 2 [Ipomoea batatas]
MEEKVAGGGATKRPHLMKEKDYTALKELYAHHIESFDHMVDQGLETMLMAIKPVEVSDPFSGHKLRNILSF